jgi:hypothetical protein
MSTKDRTPFNATIQGLNWIFWLASIALWLWIVIHSGIWSAGFTSDIFLINALFFLAAGLGTLATTHFAANALPLLLGTMAITAHDVKADWLWVTLYILTSAVIGFVAGLIKLMVFLSSRRTRPIDRDA